jgi:hypothetical protein
MFRSHSIETAVMAVPGLDPGIVPAIHVLLAAPKQDVDARDKRGVLRD